MKTEKTEELALLVLRAGALEIRDVPLKLTKEQAAILPREQQPFLYSSGNFGPGYVSIKDLVGRKSIIKPLAARLAMMAAEEAPFVNFVAGNVTGGVVPGWILSEELETILGRTVPFVYVREADVRKYGGQKRVSGLANNPEIKTGDSAVIVEELVNFGETLCSSSSFLREAGYRADFGACIMFYDNPVAVKKINDYGIDIIYLLTLPDLLEAAEKHCTHPVRLIKDYRDFLAEPLSWQAARGLARKQPVRAGRR